MKVKLLTLMAGPEGSFSPGSLLDVEKTKAEALINGKYAVFMEPEPEPEIEPIKEPEVIIPKPEGKPKPKKGR